jgi:DNA transformation protein
MSDAGLVEHCTELLGGAGRVRVRRMFGGHGFYVDGLFLALLAGEQLYLKADEAARPAFKDAGCFPFDFSTAEGKRVVLGYWSAPGEAMDSPGLMQPWLRLATASALRAQAAKKPSKPRSPRAKAPSTPATPAPARKAARRR